ncbi:thioesterase family protein [Spirobacillus cienkowskii]|uniref:acyl-CoA thioesterase n=1 Tax=Spirobacillus cienkowskii TaxID=495820 RepID=UPI0030CFEA04
MNISESKFLNKVLIETKWTDLDAYHHINNSKFFDYMTEARSQLFFEQSLSENAIQLVLYECKISFKKQLKYPNKVWVEQYISKIEGASFDLSYIIKSFKNSEIIHADAEIKMVCFDPIKNKVCRIPKNILEIILKQN